jgi:hypothetical protein
VERKWKSASDNWVIWSRRWGQEYISELRPTMGILFIPRWYISMGEPRQNNDVGIGKLLTHPPELSGNPTSRVTWEQVGGMDKMSDNFTLKAFCSHLQVIMTCHKIFWHGASRYTFHPKEGVLHIFITLKNPSPWLGLNPQTLGPVARTPTITPLRQLISRKKDKFYLATQISWQVEYKCYHD